MNSLERSALVVLLMCGHPARSCEVLDALVIGAGPSGLAVASALSGLQPHLTKYRHPDVAVERALRIVRSSANPTSDGVTPLVASVARAGNVGREYTCAASTGAMCNGTDNDDNYGRDNTFGSAVRLVESRSVHPTSIIMDSVFNPLADSGGSVVPRGGRRLVEFRRDKDIEGRPKQKFSYVVIDKGQKVGGAWQTMLGDTNTLSPAYWMRLPEDIDDEEEEDHASVAVGSLLGSDRVLRGRVADYYVRFGDRLMRSAHDGANCGGANFVPDMKVVAVEKVEVDVASEKPLNKSLVWRVTAVPAQPGGSANLPAATVRTSDSEQQTRTWWSRTLVLAGGAASLPKSLGVPGEGSFPGIVGHRFLSGVSARVDVKEETTAKAELPPKAIVIIGAGLSASDAVLRALGETKADDKAPAGRGIRPVRQGKVVHIFRSDAKSTKLHSMFGSTLEAVRNSFRGRSVDWMHVARTQKYAEYLWLLSLMLGLETDDGYVPMPDTVVEEFQHVDPANSVGSGDVSVLCRRGARNVQASAGNGNRELQEVVAASSVAILIGSEPDLSFLPDEVRAELLLKPSVEADSNGGQRAQPATNMHDGKVSKHKAWIEVDGFTSQHPTIQPPLFAVGPMRGDNFVRFIWPDAFGIVGRLSELSRLET
eukprot:TRINITY_DN74666_c0_g1_i1.p1 TRINITY_DN74666_c0_g1~~TRINITY_DN74666_c0_g1_i1.p1  ORF type:complete len:652 (-),score=78.16 TRINITY_DN74666_c0_g1_i1:70-2025(-)